MKKTFKFLSVIVSILTVLYVAGCCPKDGIKPIYEPNVVIIHLKYVEINGVKHLLMFDSNTDANIDNLITEVRAGGKVIWRLGKNSGISKIDNIYPNTDKPIIFKEGAKPNGKEFILNVPADVKSNTEEEYSISFTLVDSTKVTIDPFLRIPE